MPDSAAPSAPAPLSTTPSPAFVAPPTYFAEALVDAELLLKYAAESGITVDDVSRNAVLAARSVAESGWTEEIAAGLMAGLTRLAVLARPVTANSLRASAEAIRPTVRSYFIMAICLAALIVPFSVASFLVSSISTTLRADIDTANDLAVKLDTQTRPPQPTFAPNPAPSSAPAMATGPVALQPVAAAAPAEKKPGFVPCSIPASSDNGPVVPLSPTVNQADVVSELQQYASAIRSIDARARQLNVLVLHTERDPCAGIRKDPAELHQVFELPAGIPNLAQAAEERTTVYQEVRFFAQSLLEDTSFFYGAITSCILPALYALLGTCAYLLRTFEQQMSTRTFIPSDANTARFLIAGIGGAVVGLFNNLTITQGATVPPLALAFLVGYAVDVFFAFLEGLMQSFTRNAGTSPAAAPAVQDK
ncbi:MAG: hypothetical protein ABR923_16955 [Terracidiphilus sp.]|jgi:hypothetical protein